MTQFSGFLSPLSALITASTFLLIASFGSLEKKSQEDVCVCVRARAPYK